jgi:hypothetical protein
MTDIRKKRPKFITVRWSDHHESDNPWDAAGSEPGAALFESRGWLIFENDLLIELSNTKPLNSLGGGDLWGRPLRLLKAAISYRSDSKPVDVSKDRAA